MFFFWSDLCVDLFLAWHFQNHPGNNIGIRDAKQLPVDDVGHEGLALDSLDLKLLLMVQKSGEKTS